ncbi:MAG: hypothetical protein ACR2OE_09740 [Thermomicrobiales bacterium]
MSAAPSPPSVKAPEPATALAADHGEPVPPSLSGSNSFGRIRRENEQDSPKEPMEAPRIWLMLACVCSALVVASGFAPWLIFARDEGGTRTIPGIETDGVLVTICGVAAFLALGCVIGREDKVLPATIAFGAACCCLLFTVANWMLIDMYVDPAISKLPPSAGWGIMLAIVASLLTVIAAFRVLRVVRVY